MAAALRQTLKAPSFRRRFSAALSTAAAIADPKPPSFPADDVSAAKSAIRSESDPDRLVSLFESVAHHPAFHGDRPLYRLSIQKLARHRRPDLIERLLEGAKSDPAAPKSEGFLLRLLSLYSDAGMIDHAVRTFEAMPGIGCRHSERSLCGLLSAFLKNREFDRLFHTFNRAFDELRVAPGIASYNVFLKGLTSKGDIEKARSLLDEMPQRGVMPDITCYHTVMNGYLSKGDEFGFEEVLKEITKKDLTPNVTTFNLRIAVLCKKGKTFEAEEMLDVMISKGILPNRITFNSIIDGFCNEGNVDSAMKVFERMDGIKRPYGSGISPNFETYIMLLKNLLEKGELGKALEIFKECLEKKWAPPFELVKALIDGLIKTSQVDEAKDVVARMRKAIKGDARDAWSKIEADFSL